MSFCPNCRRPDGETLTWVPVCIVNDSEDEPPAKRRKVDDGCAICFEKATETNEIVTTACCHQKGHVACLRSYYDLPAECGSRHQRKKIARRLGIPNCFVCRGDPERIAPLDKGVLEAILPEVRKKPRVVDVAYANGGLVAWKQVIERTVDDLTLNALHRYSLDAGTVRVRYENGTVESKRLAGFGDLANNATTRKRLRQQLTETVHRWAGLPPMAKTFDERTCRHFTMRGIDELVLNLTISHHYSRAKRSTRPGAAPFAVEYEDATIATWTCTGHYFDFGDRGFDEVSGTDPYSARLYCWNYDFARPDASERRGVAEDK